MANGRKSNGKWVDRWREGGRHRQRTFDRRGDRDAMIVSVLAYAGLRPQELLALMWEDVDDGRIAVRRKNVDGTLYPYTKTRQDRTVDLLAPLATDFAEW